jgi:predicted  nucleic acid-binding Zn-ribbon protein
MPSVAPVARVAFVVEAISGLQRLRREMARLSQRGEDYESKKRALQATIQELRKMISANAP